MAQVLSWRRLVLCLACLGSFSLLLSSYTLLYRTQPADAALQGAGLVVQGNYRLGIVPPAPESALPHQRLERRLPNREAIEEPLVLENRRTNRDLNFHTSSESPSSFPPPPTSAVASSIPTTNNTRNTSKIPSLQIGLPYKLKKQFPDFMIIGFGKAGTRALYNALRLHPQLSGPQKEERFFSLKYKKGLNKYLTSFPQRLPGGYLIEKSPDYILHPRVPDRIMAATKLAEKDAKEMRFIVITRNPIDRAMSEYLEWNTQRKLSRSPKLPGFEKMVFNNGVLHTEQPFINGSCYEHYIKSWLRTFKQSQMCYVDGDAFAKDPLTQVRKLESCMALQTFFTVDHFIYNRLKGFYCFKSRVTTQCMGGGKGRPHPPIDTEVRVHLAEYFQQCNSHLAQYTGFEISY